jgi:NAD(P)-dependent dehydrogenase (short-subunit alcohol dehydrogenase family)
MILQDRVAIVTASGSGIGRAGAAKMASQQAKFAMPGTEPRRTPPT